MRILFVVPYAPSLIRVRPYQLTRHLARLGHEVSLLTLWSDQEEQKSLNELADVGVNIKAYRLRRWRPIWNCGRACFNRLPLQAAYCWHPELASDLSAFIEQSLVDVVHVEHLRGALYGLEALRVLECRARRDRPQGRPPVVWDSVDCISYLFGQARRRSSTLRARCITGLEEARTRRYEGQLVHRFDQVLVTSEMDHLQLKKLAAEAVVESDREVPVSVLGNGVDLDYFCPTGEPRAPATLVFSGKMSYHANVTSAIHLIQEVMPVVWSRRPDVRVVIVGKKPSREVLRLGNSQGRHRSAGQETHGRVFVTGEVADLRPYLRTATAAVVPLVYGAGIQNKVLEAMACGTPVISSPKAVSALEVQPGRDVLVAESSRELAERILSLLENPKKQKELGRAGRSYVCKRHDWRRTAEQLVRIYRKAKDLHLGVSSAA